MLQEAAFELFLENSYAGTTVDQIAQRAGVSRNTFFNYFPSKSDVFWVDLDESLGLLMESLRASSTDTPVMSAIRDALLAVASDFGPNRVPWALTQYSMIGSVHELQASAMSRLSAQAHVLGSFVADRLPAGARGLGRAASFAAFGAAVAAAQDWANAGTTRGEFGPYLDAAVTPVCRGFQGAIDAL
ncbi:TetR family transcriptional regulator [Glaciihabitans arcticus]|uniref:TetR family transcriptional regulator n=1 Tax=Glaciihabitans arcticus TaxID=2668039 RepID=A0A4Q9GQB5_9MICO|nr:TetR family transcriptional regulator [Glaciihabitans arcticus]TBN57062.1 TetR family transcriptional regulator [Glaciihabitans arcticus]